MTELDTQGMDLNIELPAAVVTVPKYKQKENAQRLLISCADYPPGTEILDADGTRYQQTERGLRRISSKLSGKQLRRMRRAAVQTIETR